MIDTMVLFTKSGFFRSRVDLLAHELGHLFGAHHDDNTAFSKDNDLYDYYYYDQARGFSDNETRIHTVMA